MTSGCSICRQGLRRRVQRNQLIPSSTGAAKALHL